MWYIVQSTQKTLYIIDNKPYDEVLGADKLQTKVDQRKVLSMHNSIITADKGSDVYTSQLSLPVLAG